MAVVDGHQMFNRPGPRLIDGLEWLVGLLHDRHDIIPPGFPWCLLQDLHLPAEADAAGEPCLACNMHNLVCPLVHVTIFTSPGILTWHAPLAFQQHWEQSY